MDLDDCVIGDKSEERLWDCIVLCYYESNLYGNLWYSNFQLLVVDKEGDHFTVLG